MKKSIQSVFLAFVFLTVLLSGCAPASTPVPPTSTPLPLPTDTPLPTKTPLPTEMPTQKPTESAPTTADFLATTDNEFPLVEFPDYLALFNLTIDFGRPIYVNETLPDGMNIKAWYVGEEGEGKGKVIFLVPSFYENAEITHNILLAGVSVKNGRDYTMSPEAIGRETDLFLPASNLSKEKVKVQAAIGLKTSKQLRYNDFFPSIYATTQWDESITKFMASGEPNDLITITIGGITGKLLPAVMISRYYPPPSE